MLTWEGKLGVVNTAAIAAPKAGQQGKSSSLAGKLLEVLEPGN